MSILNDLLLLNYYEGVYLGRLDYTEDVEEATEEYFNWLAETATKYNINFSRIVSDDNIKILYEDIEEYLLNNLSIIDLESRSEMVISDLERYIENGKVKDMDIMMVCDNYLSNEDIYNRVYDKLIEKKVEIL